MRQIKEKKKAFSLLELMVVMSLIAMLTAIGAGSWISSRDMARMQSYAQDIVSNIRDAQNRAISTVPAPSGDDIYVWRVAIENSGSTYSYGLQGLSSSSPTPPMELTKIIKVKANILPAGVSLVNETTVAQYKNFPIYISFTTPFGKSYQSKTELSSAVGCKWIEGSATKFTNEFIPSIACSGKYTAGDSNINSDIEYVFRIKIGGRDNGPKIKIKANGDTRIEY